MKPIRIYQCKDDCCIIRVPSRRFWYVGWADAEKDTAGSFRDAIAKADALREDMSSPQEVTA